jgi:hypothetical protein
VWSFLVFDFWVVERASKGQFACKGSSINKEIEQGHKDLQAHSRKEGAHIPRNHCRACVELAEYQVPLYLSSLLHCMLEAHYIYIHSSQTGFP